MKRIKINHAVLLLCASLILTLSTAAATAPMENQNQTFQVDHNAYKVSVVPTDTGSHVLLRNKTTQNLSQHLPGENLFPMTSIEKNTGRFIITWMNYNFHDVKLCTYDSKFNETNILPMANFKSASPIKVIFNHNMPYLLLFKGNNSDNADIFFYRFQTHSITNLTNTAASEQEFHISEDRDFIIIDTKTLTHRNIYELNTFTLGHKLVLHKPHLPITAEPDPDPKPGIFINTMLGFGDSITWGMIRMNPDDDSDHYHPEQTFLAQLQDMFTQNYGETYIVNLGIPRETAYDGTKRMHEEFSQNHSFFCLVMFGTNDVTSPHFDANASVDSLRHILTTARSTYGMYPMISTIPPQKKETRAPGIQFYKENTEALNARIIEMAVANNVPYIDTYKAFFDYGNWHALLEAYQGNHPSPLGHQVIADLYKPVILGLTPAQPAGFAASTPDGLLRTASWNNNLEFDFSHYVIQFGFSPTDLDRTMNSTSNQAEFQVFPYYTHFHDSIYYKVRAVDIDGNSSGFSAVQSVDIR